MTRNLSRAALELTACLFATPSLSDELTKDAAIGGAIGGALGGALGAELGDREGAIVGAGVGAAVGVAVATTHYEALAPRQPPSDVAVVWVRPENRFCPPGQAKKGRC